MIEESRIEDLKYLRTKLKCGEYDGTDIMQAWIAIDQLILMQTCSIECGKKHKAVGVSNGN
tara:strand:+ start:109 stop:291 length:183 start_codon:yes stop_codon:yes gene_type:complete